MHRLGRIAGWGLVVLFVVVLPCSLWTFNTQRIALDGATYQTVFTDEGFYADILPGMLPALLKELGRSTPVPGEITLLDAINHLPPQTWDAIAPDLVPPEWVKDEVDKNFDAFLAWLNGHADLDLVFNTDALRVRLASDAGAAAVERIGAAFPPCSTEQADQLARFLDTESGVEFPYCRPTDSAQLADFDALLNAARLAALDALPTTLDVVEEMRAASQTHLADNGQPVVPSNAFSDAQLNRFRSTIQLWRQLLPLTLMIPLALLSLLVIVVVRTARTFFRWIGWALMAGSLLTLLPLFVLPFVVHGLDYSAQIERGFATGGALIAEVVSDRMVRLLIGAFTWPILFQAALLIGVGFVFAVISVLLPEPETPTAAPAAQTVMAYVMTPTGLTPAGTLTPSPAPYPDTASSRPLPPSDQDTP